MKSIPRFWTTAEDDVRTPAGTTLALRIWGWSTTSLADAASVAAERLRQVSAAASRGERLASWAYYPRLPLREETLAEVTTQDGTLLGIVTRNRYGAEVLNTDRILIADIDLPEEVQPPHPRQGRSPGLVGRLLGRNRREEPGTNLEPGAVGDGLRAAIERIDRFAAAHQDLGVRTYRTAAGLRVIVTGGDLPAGSLAAESALRELDSDPLYVRLCTTHETYRARLTPKPWRCGWASATIPWPHEATQRARAERWLEGYTERSDGFATTRLLSSTGPLANPEEAQLLTLHDGVTRAEQDLPLA